MDWKLAVSRNRDQLRGIVAALFVLARMRVGGVLVVLPRSVLASIMLVLRPAESAVRRLIVIAAAGLGTVGPSHRDVDASALARLRDLRQLHPVFRTRAFQLFDPLKTFDMEALWDCEAPAYQSWYANHDSAFSAASQPVPHDQPINAAHIGQRLNALMRALDDLPRQARRLAHWRVRQDRALAENRPLRPARLSTLRPGLPPGWRERAVHEIDPVLRECHALAGYLPDAPDSS